MFYWWWCLVAYTYLFVVLLRVVGCLCCLFVALWLFDFCGTCVGWINSVVILFFFFPLFLYGLMFEFFMLVDCVLCLLFWLFLV